MTLIDQYFSPDLEIPPSWLPLLEKIMRWYDNQKYPIFGPFFSHGTRSAKAENKERTYLYKISDAWKELDQETKDAWETASAFGTLNRYQLFTSDYSYRRKIGLSLPGAPNAFHQLFGMRLQNPSGSVNVRLRRDEKDLVGPVTIAFNYLKTENAPTGDLPFKFIATLYYFADGQNKEITHEWSAPAGNVDWVSVFEQFGVVGLPYFHLRLIWYFDGYDAIVDLDRLLISDQNGDKYREDWQFKAGKTWSYDDLYRKTGWLFTPGFRVPYFEVLYLV
ncbi:MAG TPA: hypothetical protein VMY36_00135 [Patescibacteria group bacterium]|nr:hypothetical protein [Patescibacteria group bacterium]